MTEIKFDNLLTYSIKRLARPKIKHDVLTLNDPLAYQTYDEDPEVKTQTGF